MKISKFSRGKGKYLLIGLIIYAVLFFILMVIRGDILADNETTLLWFSELRKENDFLTSYLASSLDSLIFFALIGAAAILISVKDPSDELLFQKINYIFPQTQRDTALTKYIQDEISSLACIATDLKRSITIKELSPNNECIKLDVKGRSHIKNIFNNHDYVSEKMVFKMAADPVESSTVWAEMLEASITCDVSKPLDAAQQLNGTIVLDKNKKSHKELLPITLGPNKEALFTTHGWFWHNVSENFKFSTSRFVEKASYDVKNDLDMTVHFSIKSNKLQISISKKLINKIKDIFSKKNLPEAKESELNKLIDPVVDDKELETKNYTLLPGAKTTITFNTVIPTDTIIFIFSVDKAKSKIDGSEEINGNAEVDEVNS